MENENNKNIEPGLIEPIIFEESNSKPQLVAPIEFDIRTKSPEKKIYIILYKIIDDEMEEEYRNIYSICVGRTETYMDIISKLQSGIDIDINRSKIITETKQLEKATGESKYFLLPYNDCISVYSFCIQVKEYFDIVDFNIEDYNTTDIPENDEELNSHPMYLSAEQQQYRDMIFSAMREESNIERARMNQSDGENNI